MFRGDMFVRFEQLSMLGKYTVRKLLNQSMHITTIEELAAKKFHHLVQLSVGKWNF